MHQDLTVKHPVTQRLTCPTHLLCSKLGFLKQRCATCPGHLCVGKCLWHSCSEGKSQTQLSRDCKPELLTASLWCTGLSYEENRVMSPQSLENSVLVKCAQSLPLYRMSWKMQNNVKEWPEVCHCYYL